MNVLVIAAHPDDELLGCGGTMARMAKEGHDVYAIILGEGITSRFGKREEAETSALSDLRQCSHRVAELLGVRELSLHGLPDNRFDSLPLLDIIKIVENQIDRRRPHTVFTHHGGDINVDHQVVSRAVLTATRPTQGHPVKELYMFEVASSTEWGFQQLAPVFKPNVFVDIEETLDLKIQGMNLYESESRVFPHPRSEKALTLIAQRWGSVVGRNAVEAFEAVRIIR